MKYLFPFLLLILAACNNNSPKKDKIMEQFDSANNEVKKIAAERTIDNMALYDSLRVKWNGAGKYGLTQQLYYTVNDFNGYLSETRRKFIQFCGDSTGQILPGASEDSLALTNAFFLDPKSVGYLFFHQLQELVSHFETNATTDPAKSMVNKISSVTTKKFKDPKEFAEKYFKNIPPVAALTILASFEAQVKNTERRILMDYINQ
jgi:hypothetical protein